MTMAGILAIALAATPGAILAQDGDAEELPVPAYLTATDTETGTFVVPFDYERFDWGTRQSAGLRYQTTSDDPRAAGDIDMVFTYDTASSDSDMGRGVGLARLTNDGGSWIGPVHVIYYPDGSEARFAVLEGQDGYAGLSYAMTNFLDGQGGEQSQGLIWEGELPPLPDSESLPDLESVPD
jgi:hypothetical protein